MASQTHLPIVSLKFSLADDPRTHIKEWHEDLCAKAYGLCPQWDITGAITLIADDAYWNAMPGHITTPAAGTTAAVYKARPDFTPPAALDPAASPVDLATWRLEMDMHFAYALASKALATAILDSLGASNQAALKVAYHPRLLHFLTPWKWSRKCSGSMLRSPDRTCKSYGLPCMSPYKPLQISKNI